MTSTSSLFGGSEAVPLDRSGHRSPSTTTNFSLNGFQNYNRLPSLGPALDTNIQPSLPSASARTTWDFSNLDDAVPDTENAHTTARVDRSVPLEVGVLASQTRKNEVGSPAPPSADDHHDNASTPIHASDPKINASTTNSSSSANPRKLTLPTPPPHADETTLKQSHHQQHQASQQSSTTTWQSIPWTPSTGSTHTSNSTNKPKSSTTPPPPPSPPPPHPFTLRESIRASPLYLGGFTREEHDDSGDYDPEKPDAWMSSRRGRITKCSVVRRKRGVSPKNEGVIVTDDNGDGNVSAAGAQPPKKKTKRSNAQRRREGESLIVSMKIPERCRSVLEGKSSNWPYEVCESKGLLDADVDVLLKRNGGGVGDTSITTSEKRLLRNRRDIGHDNDEVRQPDLTETAGNPSTSCVEAVVPCTSEPPQPETAASASSTVKAPVASAVGTQANDALQLGSCTLTKNQDKESDAGSPKDTAGSAAAKTAKTAKTATRALDLGHCILKDKSRKKERHVLPGESTTTFPPKHSCKTDNTTNFPKKHIPTPPPQDQNQSLQPRLPSTTTNPPIALKTPNPNPNPTNPTTTTTVHTTPSLTHPIKFNHRPTRTSPCHFCSSPLSPIFGRHDAPPSAYPQPPNSTCTPTKTHICTRCTYTRARILHCSGHGTHDLTRTPNHSGAAREGIRTSKASVQELISDLRAAAQTARPHGERMLEVRGQLQRWCSVCPAPAVWTCCTAQVYPAAPDVVQHSRGVHTGALQRDATTTSPVRTRGCGLNLCWACAALYTRRFGGDLEGMVEGLRGAAPRAFYPRGLRGDVGLLVWGGNCMVEQLGWRR